MAIDSEIVKLAHIISSRTTELDGYFKAENVPNPATDINAPPIQHLPPHVMQSKMEIIVAMDRMKTLIQSPLENLLETFALQHQVPSQIKVGEELTYQQLSERCGLNESDLRRVMRMLVCMGLFSEPRKGFVTHNSSSRILNENSMLANWMRYGTKFIWAGSFATPDAMGKYPDAQELNETAYYLFRGQTFWDTLASNKGDAELFEGAMGFLQNSPQFGSHHLVRELEWDGADCPKSMVDVGGHNGSIAADILRRYPVEKCIVEDRLEVISAASVPQDLQGRLEFKEHDFFTPQPVRADVYLLRSICHDWSDKYASQIISNLVPALKPGAKVIVNEVCMPDPGVVPRPMESMIRAYDLCMKQFFNSKERSIEEWTALFHGCDARFKLSRVKAPPGSALAVIEFVWTE